MPFPAHTSLPTNLILQTLQCQLWKIFCWGVTQEIAPFCIAMQSYTLQQLGSSLGKQPQFDVSFFHSWILLTLGYSPQPKDILLRPPYLLVIFNSLFIVNQPLYEKFPFHITLRYLSTDWIRLIHSKGKYMSLLSRWQSRRT